MKCQMVVSRIKVMKQNLNFMHAFLEALCVKVLPQANFISISFFLHMFKLIFWWNWASWTKCSYLITLILHKSKKETKHLHHNFDMSICSSKRSNTLKFSFKIFSYLQEAFGVSKCNAHLLQMGNTKFIFFIIGTFVIGLAILKSVRQLENGICSKNGWLLWT
jgi:hypothetical protein